MKTLALIPIFLLFIIHPTQAQTDSALTRDIYRAWVIPVQKSRAKPWSPPTERNPVTQGALYEVKDSSLLISTAFSNEEYAHNNFDVSKVDVRSIDVIKIRKKGNQGLGILIGAISGLAVAGVLDLIIYSNWKKVEGANSLEEGLNYIFVQTPQFIAVIAGSIGLLGAGIGIGAAVGSASIKIPIKGSQKLFDKNRSRLNDYSIKYNPELGGKSFSKLSDTILDMDGNVYHTLALGGQVWMAENLKGTRYRDGSEIPDATDNNSGTGRQYNWFAVNDSKNLCPAGWHVPSFGEWTSFFNSLGGLDNAGRKLEEGFSTTDKVCQWWSSTETDTVQAQSIYLNNGSIGVMFTNTAKSTGLSVRCIRDY